MNHWFNSLLPRERALVTYGSIAVLVILLGLGAKPLYNNQAKLKKTIASQRTALITMQEQSAEIKQLRQQKTVKPQNTGSQNPQQLIERSLQNRRLKDVLERMQSQGSKGVSIILKNANADRVMHFLYELESKHSLLINSMVVNSNNKKAGFADFRLTIKNSKK